MSYYFDMAFTEAADLGSAMVKAHELVKFEMQPKMAEKIISQNLIYVPSLRYVRRGEKGFESLKDVADKKWLYSLFNKRFVFWPDYHLLGVVGIAPEELNEWHGVAFQDSTDQDYDFDEWPQLPFFAEEVEKAKSALACPKEVAFQIMKSDEGLSEWLDEWQREGKDINEDRLNYCLKSWVYRTIFDKLHLNKWLYGNDNSGFERFAINGIESQEQELQLSFILRRCKKHADCEN